MQLMCIEVKFVSEATIQKKLVKGFGMTLLPL